MPGLGGCPGLTLTACLLCADPSLPRPSISLSPTGVTAPGADVTIRCQGQRRDVTFFLHKAGDLNPPRQMDPAEAGAEFLIPTVGRQHGGNYRCSYRLQSEPFVSSQPSDPVQLVVAGEGPGLTSPLPAPSPARPSWGLHADGMLRARLCPELWAQQRDARLRSGDGTERSGEGTVERSWCSRNVNCCPGSGMNSANGSYCPGELSNSSQCDPTQQFLLHQRTLIHL
uniref:Ig-like domain-containing protein n=1 Tax=Chrysemys picta bellii TaxID=8478 RepID=A0A8C3FKI6_CHRPI